jgi:hypothetical protein
MKRQLIFAVQISGMMLLVVALAFLAGCQSESGAADEVAESEATDAPTAVPPEPVEPTPLPEPTPTEGPALITSADEMVGIWLGTVGGDPGYVMYTDDGRFAVDLIQDNLGTTPRVSGEYWFEDGKIHLRDLENLGHWANCDPETIGVYEVMVLESGNVQFQISNDDCDEGGFTRNWLFTNMTQEWIAEPVSP